jgi:hypothetical protein
MRSNSFNMGNFVVETTRIRTVAPKVGLLPGAGKGWRQHATEFFFLRYFSMLI